VNSNRDDLITALSGELQAVKPVVRVDRMAILWLLVSALYVIAVTHLLGPVRPNALSQLASEPRFLLETLSGALGLAVTSLIAFRAAIPGALTGRFAAVGAVLMLVWLGSYIVGLFNPALEPSMLGKRPHCVWETFLYALPPMAVGFVMVRRLYPLQPVQTAMSIGLVAGMVPALYMQIACMYMPVHILQMHILPGLLVVLVGAAVAWISRPRQGDELH
jgi:hypothetical protein